MKTEEMKKAFVFELNELLNKFEAEISAEDHDMDCGGDGYDIRMTVDLHKYPNESIDLGRSIGTDEITNSVTEVNSKSQLYQSFGVDFILGVQIPSYFEDVSWSNDACPCFDWTVEDEPFGIRFWVDYEDSSKRENKGARYSFEVFAVGESNPFDRSDFLSIESADDCQKLLEKQERMIGLAKQHLQTIDC